MGDYEITLSEVLEEHNGTFAISFLEQPNYEIPDIEGWMITVI